MYERKINGGEFVLRFSESTARNAQLQADMIRKDGHLARIITRPAGKHLFFDVYEGRKRK